jgi:hypothetical protein
MKELYSSLIHSCKTFIHRFDSDPRLHPKPLLNQWPFGQTSCFSTSFEGPKTASKPDKNGEALAKRLTATLTRSLTAEASR